MMAMQSIVVLLGIALCSVQALEFEMLFMTKCISEEIPSSTQATMEFAAFNKNSRDEPISIKALLNDPQGIKIHEQETSSANVTFKSSQEGEYKACFNVANNAMASQVKIFLEWRLETQQAVDWDSIARKEHLDSVESYMTRFKNTIKNINDEMKEIREKEQQMREITEATNTRVVMLSLFCVAICIAITGGQVWYLRRFFLKKKII